MEHFERVKWIGQRSLWQTKGLDQGPLPPPPVSLPSTFPSWLWRCGGRRGKCPSPLPALCGGQTGQEGVGGRKQESFSQSCCCCSLSTVKSCLSSPVLSGAALVGVNLPLRCWQQVWVPSSCLCGSDTGLPLYMTGRLSTKRPLLIQTTHLGADSWPAPPGLGKKKNLYRYKHNPPVCSGGRLFPVGFIHFLLWKLTFSWLSMLLSDFINKNKGIAFL